MSAERYYLSTGKPSYSFDARTGHAKVYHRATGAVVCEVTGVSVYVGNLLSKLADEMYQDGLLTGERRALESLRDQIERSLRRGPSL